jgi:hypothetical protein
MTADNRSDLLAMFQSVEEAKAAIDKFERGEINLPEAIRLLQAATANICTD